MHRIRFGNFSYNFRYRLNQKFKFSSDHRRRRFHSLSNDQDFKSALIQESQKGEGPPNLIYAFFIKLWTKNSGKKWNQASDGSKSSQSQSQTQIQQELELPLAQILQHQPGSTIFSRRDVGRTIWPASLGMINCKGFSEELDRIMIDLNNNKSQSNLKFISVLELGSGTGCVGLQCDKELRQRINTKVNSEVNVILTDQRHIIPQLQKNADHYQTQSEQSQNLYTDNDNCKKQPQNFNQNLRVHELHWYDSKPPIDAEYDDSNDQYQAPINPTKCLDQIKQMRNFYGPFQLILASECVYREVQHRQLLETAKLLSEKASATGSEIQNQKVNEANSSSSPTVLLLSHSLSISIGPTRALNLLPNWFLANSRFIKALAYYGHYKIFDYTKWHLLREAKKLGWKYTGEWWDHDEQVWIVRLEMNG